MMLGVDSRTCGPPCDGAAVFLDCGESEVTADDVLDTASQVKLHLLGVASTPCVAPTSQLSYFL